MSLNRNTLLLSGALAVTAFNANAQDAGKEAPVVRTYGVYGSGIAVEDSIRKMLGQEELAVMKLGEGQYEVAALDSIGKVGRARSYFVASKNALLDANEIVGRETMYMRSGASSYQTALRIVEKVDTITGELLPFVEGVTWMGEENTESYNVSNEFGEIRPLMPITLKDRSNEAHNLFNYDELVSYLEGEILEYGPGELSRNVELLDVAAERAESHYRFQRSVETLIPGLK